MAEYERRFRVEQIPDQLLSSAVSVQWVRQAYWHLGGGWVLRLRRIGSETSVAIKGPRIGVRRVEAETPLASMATGEVKGTDIPEISIKLFREARERTIEKTRYSVVVAGQAWDVDVFHGKNEGLVIAEVEARSARILEHVVVPAWCVEEVTGIGDFNNETLAITPWSLLKNNR